MPELSLTHAIVRSTSVSPLMCRQQHHERFAFILALCVSWSERCSLESRGQRKAPSLQTHGVWRVGSNGARMRYCGTIQNLLYSFVCTEIALATFEPIVVLDATVATLLLPQQGRLPQGGSVYSLGAVTIFLSDTPPSSW